MSHLPRHTFYAKFYFLWQCLVNSPSSFTDLLLPGKIPCGYSGGCDPLYKPPFPFPLNLCDGQYDAPPPDHRLVKDLFPHLLAVLLEGGPKLLVLFGDCLELKEILLSRSHVPPGVSCIQWLITKWVLRLQAQPDVGQLKDRPSSQLPGEELLPAPCCFLFLPGADPRSTPKKPLALCRPNLHHLRICRLGSTSAIAPRVMLGHSH